MEDDARFGEKVMGSRLVFIHSSDYLVGARLRPTKEVGQWSSGVGSTAAVKLDYR